MLAWWRSGIKIAIVVSISMVIIVTYGSMMGMMLPFIFRKLKVDPAAASGPLVASLADISGVMIYLGIASAMLKRFGR
jgi:magnesium transporter